MSSENLNDHLAMNDDLDKSLIRMGYTSQSQGRKSGPLKVVAVYEFSGTDVCDLYYRIEVVREIGTAPPIYYETHVYGMGQVDFTDSDKKGSCDVWRLLERDLARGCKTPEEAIEETIGIMENRGWLKKR